MYILRSSFTKCGKTYYARDYGKRAFLIYIDEATKKPKVKL